jgi:FAD/FMN-containing dehydrogenase/Fe-S oxidoreductase
MPQLPVLNNRTPREDLGGISGSGGPIWDAERERIAGGLRELLSIGSGPDQTGGEVRFGRHDRLLYSTDASLYQVEPIGVVVPASVDDAARVVQWCADRKVAMLPRGGGTSLAGQCTNRAVVVDISAYCRTIRSVDIAARTCDVEPGVSIDGLNEHLSKNETGLFFAPDPATTRQCAIGGAIGNNAAGARSILYGRTSENVESIDIALASRAGERVRLGPNAGRHDDVARRLGEGALKIVQANAHLIHERFPKTIRRNAGYGLDMILDQLEAGATPESVDLSKLLCGSEGTLAVTLGATLKLHPLPKFKGLALIAFDSVDAAIDAVQPILATGPSAVELLDDVVLDAARGNEECRRYLEIMPRAANGRNANAILYVEYFAFKSANELGENFADLRTTLAAHAHPDSIREYTDGPSMAKAWALRKAGEPLLHGMPGSRKPITFVEDNAVPVEHLGEFVREFRKIVSKHGTRAAYWAHASVGVLHVRPMIDIHDPADREKLRAIAVEVADLARACGGIMSGEHGDGRVRGPLLERFFGPEIMRAFRDIKRLFDPLNVLNPGNIAYPGPVETITANLRVDAEDAVSRAQAGELPKQSAGAVGAAANRLDTFFDYTDQQGFAHAVEQCNGAGVCRKRGGVMCPSYQATLDERHSTRGRGNALRLAITGQFPTDLRAAGHAPNWNDPETIKTLDLCLSCKACKSECPSNVDIARLKAEYTGQRLRGQKRIPLATLATGYVRVLNKLGAIVPGLANLGASSPPGRAIVDRIMQMHPKRSLPRFSRSLYRAFVPEERPAATPTAVLFTDCFTTYNESPIGVAAGRVLEKLGYRVQLSGSHCCARSMISVGMLPQAIEAIDRTLEALQPAIDDENVRAIAVCEPSCLSAIKDDWLALKCATPLDVRKRLAAKAFLPEEFVHRSWDQHPTPFTGGLALPDSTVLFHAHCHQKSLWSAESSAALLRRLVGDRLKVLDTGCCGMAGSFGFGRDKFDLSMRIGELSVLPIVREAPSDAIIVATGTSCRHQIHDGAHRRAIHPIELVAQLLNC